MLMSLIDKLFVRVFGHCAHCYDITITFPLAAVPFKYSRQETIKFVGPYTEAVGMAKGFLGLSKVSYVAVQTRGGLKVWEGER